MKLQWTKDELQVKEVSICQVKWLLQGLSIEQEKDWFLLGLVLSRAEMAHWVIRCSQEWLTPIYERIHRQFLECDVLHMDETRIQCNKEEGRKAGSDSFMWVMRSAASESVQAAYFHYSSSRSTETAKDLVGDYTGYLITDAYAGYNKAGNYAL